MFLHREKGHADAVRTGLRQLEAQFGTLTREKLVRELDENASAVACFRVATAGAAVRQVDQDLDSFADDVVTLLS